jgi:hypothetical protein
MTTDNDYSRQTLSSKDAYAAMYAFLMKFNTTFKSDDVEILLTGMSTAQDDEPMDNAYLLEWNECVAKAINGEVSTRIEMEK